MVPVVLTQTPNYHLSSPAVKQRSNWCCGTLMSIFNGFWTFADFETVSGITNVSKNIWHITVIRQNDIFLPKAFFCNTFHSKLCYAKMYPMSQFHTTDKGKWIIKNRNICICLLRLLLCRGHKIFFVFGYNVYQDWKYV